LNLSFGFDVKYFSGAEVIEHCDGFTETFRFREEGDQRRHFRLPHRNRNIDTKYPN